MCLFIFMYKYVWFFYKSNPWGWDSKWQLQTIPDLDIPMDKKQLQAQFDDSVSSNAEHPESNWYLEGLT